MTIGFLTAYTTVPSRHLEGARSRKARETQEIRMFPAIKCIPGSQHAVQKAEHGNTVIGEVKVCVPATEFQGGRVLNLS